MKSEHVSRRDFLRVSTAAGVGVVVGGVALSGCQGSTLTAAPVAFSHKPLERVKVGFVGVGGQGSSHVKNLLNIEGVEVCAICDIVEDRVSRMQDRVEKAGQPRPTGYSRGEWDFKRMCAEEDLDIVFNATPWRWHVPICLAAMQNGKHAASEVPIAYTVEDCWQLVETSEKTRRYCTMLENCCYDRVAMMILTMAQQGALGTLLHAECGYLHDLRLHKFNLHGNEGTWRTEHSRKRNGNLYPTHGIGPVAWWLDIYRGDTFDYLVSMSSKSVSLNEFAAEKFGPDDPRVKEKFALGDINSSLIRTAQGRTIIVKHDTNTPRPYSRINLLQGAKGIVREWPKPLIHIEGRSKPHTWQDIDEYKEEYTHPFWRDLSQEARKGGHGGMDYIVSDRLIQALRQGVAPDISVYDAVAWSVIGPLSEQSVARKSRPVDFPDFTRGAWKTHNPISIV
ncbi:MAG: Gfo/Idh/MocA family oxidoreductase [Sedimentisphaerales bacterium]|nr:Gfo/Idh/MocA family oxidoreductase [Sedimentisphaerales bacterium]